MTQKMLHVALEVGEVEAPRAAYLLAKYGVFSPEHSVLGIYNPANSGGQRYHDATQKARDKLIHLAAHYAQLPPAASTPTEPPTLSQLHEINAWLDELVQVADACRAKREAFERQLKSKTELLDELVQFESLDIDLAELARPKHFIQTLVGSVTEAELDGLTAELTQVGGIVDVFGRQAGKAYLIVVCPQLRCLLSRSLLEKHGWHEIHLPEEFIGRPREVEFELKDLCKSITQSVEKLEQEDRYKFSGITERLAYALKSIDLAEPYARLVGEAVTGPEGQLQIRGWIPQRNLARLQTKLAQQLSDAYHLEARPPLPGERESVPTAMRYPTWLGPFAELVRGYGVPCYGDYDPTLFFTLSFTVMFGMMFGDVGHGLLIILAALLLRGDVVRFRPLIVAAGVSASGFGLLYGSIFGLEGIFKPLWLAPLSDPMRMIHAALLWGVGFLAATQLIMLKNRIAARSWRAALFDAGGVAGLLLYLGGVAAAYLMYTQQPGAQVLMTIAGCGFLIILIHHCAQQTEPWPGRFFLSLMESLETVFNDFVNTLSFMRIAAFSISHVALAIAISTLSQEMGQAGKIVMLIFGNVLILVLEGSIVAIQALRLEYYEGFSRYFTCFGREFKPLMNPKTGRSSQD
jgi:V/A-type H+-transporting ATPase subunit I